MSNNDHTAEIVAAHSNRLRAGAFVTAMLRGDHLPARSMFYAEHQPYEFAVAMAGIVLDLAHRIAGSEAGVEALLLDLADADHMAADTLAGIAHLGDTDDKQEGQA